MYSLAKLKEKLEALGAAPNKSLGQNFLVNEVSVQKIVDAAKEENPTELIEIGPGLGAITEKLAQLQLPFRVIELDNKFAEYWKNQGIDCINHDALTIDWKALGLNEGSSLVSNLPYQISSSIVIDRSVAPFGITSMVLMFQKEVAQRIATNNKDKEYGLLTVIAKSFWDISLVLDAGPKDFYPPPKVASRVLKFVRKKEDPVKDNQSYLKFVKAAFQQRRKKMTKNLKSAYADKIEIISSILASMGFDENVRAEQLSPEQFIELFNNSFRL